VDEGGDDGGGDDGGGCLDVFPGQVLITEIMVNPAAAPGPAGQWLELYNAGDTSLKMKGWTLHDDAGGSCPLALGGETDFAPQTFLVVGFEADPGQNGGLEPDLVVEGVCLDSAVLYLYVELASLEIDRVDWSSDEGWPAVAGASMSLNPDKQNFMANDLAVNWCPGQDGYGEGDLGSPGQANPECPPHVECGNGSLDDGEDCDDGQNGEDLDGCKDDCSFTCLFPEMDCVNVPGDCEAPICVAGGQGQVCGVQEDLEDLPDDSNPCTEDLCLGGGLGNNVPVPDGVACDNGTDPAGDYCVMGSCDDPQCGDGIKGPAEACDDSNLDPCDGCLTDCTLHDNFCGDGHECDAEECDDGNAKSGDGCSKDCVLEECGNSILDPLEDCDDGKNGNDQDGCKDDCGYTCQVAMLDCLQVTGDCSAAQCAPGGEGQICQETEDLDDVPDDGNPCTDNVCLGGGAAAHPPVEDGTKCDNGGGLPGDYCVDGSCSDQVCGDGIKGYYEGCDDQNEDQCDGCLANCSLHDNVCGDGYVCDGEGCDDQNQDPCDGCLANCTLHDNICGDGNKCADEECDDGNLKDDDGCSSLCQEEGQNPCPADMVHIPGNPGMGLDQGYCFDRHEASRADATADSMGSDTSVAVSTAGALPWYENPFSDAKLALFQAACGAAGKRLCQEEEWFYGCTGSDESTYVWGDDWDDEVCNCVDTWCDEFCEEHDIDPCVTTTNCGYTLSYAYPDYPVPFHPVPTGSMEQCVNEFGAYDVNGNVWEIVLSDDSPKGWAYEIRGGAFNCGSPSVRLECTFSAGWKGLYAGFRCCKDLQ